MNDHHESTSGYETFRVSLPQEEVNRLASSDLKADNFQALRIKNIDGNIDGVRPQPLNESLQRNRVVIRKLGLYSVGSRSLQNKHS